MGEKEWWKDELSSDLYLENLYRYLAKKLAVSIGESGLSANFFTFLRIPLSIFVFLFFVFSRSYILLSGLIILWKLLDKIDGAVARRENQVSRFGSWFDVVVDRIYWGLTFLGLTVAAFQNVGSYLPWVLLFMVIFGHTLFQNFTFLGESLNLQEIRGVDWGGEAVKLRNNPFVYQVVFSAYYLWDQMVAVALLMHRPVKQYLSVDSFLLTLVFYSLFFGGAAFYAVWVSYRRLVEK